MPTNPDILRIADIVENLARKHNFSPEQSRDIAQVIYDSRKSMEEISFEEWQAFLKGMK